MASENDPKGRALGEAFSWVEMVLPGLAGHWLDRTWGTSPFLAAVGFLIGLVMGMTHLIVMAQASARSKTGTRRPDGK
jgi:F0F1-type ATP synthase assembly protein I